MKKYTARPKWVKVVSAGQPIVGGVVLLLILSAFVRPCYAQAVRQIDPFNHTAVKHLTVKNAAVASACPLASDIGAMILEQGGNAIDAAVAVQFALAVTYPRAGNIGGGGFLVAHLADGRNVAIDYREQAPGKATRRMFIRNGKSNSGLRHNGHLAAAVPTTLAGIFLAHQEYGSLPMRDLIQPAVELARHGFALPASEARSYNYEQDAFEAYNTVRPAFIKEGRWKAGDTLVQADLARTLELIRDHGLKGFYEGETAQKIVDEMARGNGLISLADLRHASATGAVLREPIVFDYKGHTIISMSPSSSGGIALQQMLGMLEHYPIGSYGYATVASVQLMTEIQRRMFSDRARYITDPDFATMPLKEMVSPPYLKERIANYTPGKMTPQNEIRSTKNLPVKLKESTETTHLSVVDTDGNAVSVTYTLSSNYGNKVVVGGAGFFLNNEMRAFNSNPPKGGIVNTIQPYIRMRSSMSPTVVLKEGRPWLILGTPGSETIITSIFQTLINIIDFGMSTYDAVNQPKFHFAHTPGELQLETGFPQEVATALEKMGYTIKRNQKIGRMEVIRIEGDSIEAVADSRGNDSASGY